MCKLLVVLSVLCIIGSILIILLLIIFGCFMDIILHGGVNRWTCHPVVSIVISSSSIRKLLLLLILSYLKQSGLVWTGSNFLATWMIIIRIFLLRKSRIILSVGSVCR